MATTSEQHVQTPDRPQQHRRNKSSKFLMSLVSSKSRPVSPDMTHESFSNAVHHGARTQKIPVLPPDHPHNATSRVLGERQSNAQPAPSSPSKGTSRYGSRSPTKTDSSRMKKSKSSTSISAMFGKMNRSSRDLSYAPKAQAQPHGKENTTPPDSATEPVDTPIWAQFASPDPKRSEDSQPTRSVQDEIDRYTPQDYSPGKQRNFNGTTTIRQEPSLRPAAKQRPHSTIIVPTDGFMGALSRKVSSARSSMEAKRSEDSARRISREEMRNYAGERPPLAHRHSERTERHVSGSSTEQAPVKEKLNIIKRGARVMAAVAALQGNAKGTTSKEEVVLDPKTVDREFEAVLASRNVPEPMRERMRTLTLRVKADFVRQDQGASKTADGTPAGTPMNAGTQNEAEQSQQAEDDSKSTKRSRARSRTFTFSKGDKRGGDSSPSKKARSKSNRRPVAIDIPKGQSTTDLTTPTTPTGASWGRRGHATPAVGEYISYLKKNQDPKKVEVGRLHKLRILLRNETVAWVDGFVSQGGMAEVVSLLHRLMNIEWREEHEDQLLHEGLLCLKGLCTTERALAELDMVADELFPALLGMLFDEEKKGPAEYTTRTIIVNILCKCILFPLTLLGCQLTIYTVTYLSAPMSDSHTKLEQRARKILTYLAEPTKPDTDRPVAFVLGMHVPRPYKLWNQEVSNVTKEVFWIFLHHLNVVPLPKKSDGTGTPTSEHESFMERPLDATTTYTQRHFPGLRPPVPAAPYIGGVEWDATTYMAAHLDLLNGLVASLPSAAARNLLRDELQSSGFEKTMGCTMRTCKEKFYSGVHDGLRAWVAAATEDGWETRFVREGPLMEEQAARARSSSPNKKKEAPPQLGAIGGIEAMPKLELNVGGKADDDDDGWLG
jgi:hypothetical protein